MAKKNSDSKLAGETAGFSISQIRLAVDCLQELQNFLKCGTQNLHCETVYSIISNVVQSVRINSLNSLADIQIYIAKMEGSK